MYMDVASQKWVADRDRLDARLNDILGDVADTRLVDVLLALANAVADYSDDEDENVVFNKVEEVKAELESEDHSLSIDGARNETAIEELSERVDTVEDDVQAAYYDDTELREYAERLETRIEELETQLN